MCLCCPQAMLQEQQEQQHARVATVAQQAAFVR